MNEFDRDGDGARGRFEPVTGAVPNVITTTNYFGPAPTTSPQQSSVMHGAWNGGIGDFDATSVKRRQLCLTPTHRRIRQAPRHLQHAIGMGEAVVGNLGTA